MNPETYHQLRGIKYYIGQCLLYLFAGMGFGLLIWLVPHGIPAFNQTRPGAYVTVEHTNGQWQSWLIESATNIFIRDNIFINPLTLQNTP